jgi:hypothetical protein
MKCNTIILQRMQCNHDISTLKPDTMLNSLRACLFPSNWAEINWILKLNHLAHHRIETWNLIQFRRPEFTARVGFQPIAPESLRIVLTPTSPDSITQPITLHCAAVLNPTHPQRHPIALDSITPPSPIRAEDARAVVLGPTPSVALDSSTTPLSPICPEGALCRNLVVF